MRLRFAFLTCLFLACPLTAQAQTPANAEKVQQTAAVDPDESLQKWFKEQDRLLDEILVRLSRIERIVQELHRLISQMPNFGTAPAAAPASAVVPAPAAKEPATTNKPVTVTPPVMPTRSKPTGILGFFDDWGVELAGVGVLILLALMLLRSRRGKRADGKKAESREPAVSAAGLEPADLPPAPKKPSAPAAAPAKPAPPRAAQAPAAAKAVAPAQLEHAPVPESSGDQALELAEIMLSMGLGHGAAQTLVEQIRREPSQALLHWLKLLEVYRKSGQEEEFRHSAEELRLHFNVQPEDWHAQPGQQRSIEDYPHIAGRLVELWGTEGCQTYVKNLLDDNRGGARAGFPVPVAEELVLLGVLLKARLG